MERDSLMIALQTQNADTTFNPVITDTIGWLLVAILVVFVIFIIVLIIKLIFDL